MLTHQLMSVKYTHHIVEACIHTIILVLIWWVFAPNIYSAHLQFIRIAHGRFCIEGETYNH